MSNEFKKLTQTVEKAIETVPEIYDDGLKLATQESGKTLAIIPRTINAALVPLRQWIAQKEYNIAETEKLLAQKLKDVHPNKIVTPEAYVAVPAIQSISYSIDSEDLRNLYANLLANAMNSDFKDNVHPAFVEIIKQLSPADAKVFKEIALQQTFPLATMSVSKYVSSNNTEPPSAIDKLEQPIKRYVYENLTNIQFLDYESVLLSIDNLLRLRLVEIRTSGHMTPIPTSIKDTPIYSHFETILGNYVDSNQWSFLNTCCYLVPSSLGNVFNNICVK